MAQSMQFPESATLLGATPTGVQQQPRRERSAKHVVSKWVIGRGRLWGTLIFLTEGNLGEVSWAGEGEGIEFQEISVSGAVYAFRGSHIW